MTNVSSLHHLAQDIKEKAPTATSKEIANMIEAWHDQERIEYLADIAYAAGRMQGLNSPSRYLEHKLEGWRGSQVTTFPTSGYTISIGSMTYFYDSREDWEAGNPPKSTHTTNLPSSTYRNRIGYFDLDGNLLDE